VCGEGRAAGRSEGEVDIGDKCIREHYLSITDTENGLEMRKN
jgi:hypothetical protein